MKEISRLVRTVHSVRNRVKWLLFCLRNFESIERGSTSQPILHSIHNTWKRIGTQWIKVYWIRCTGTSNRNPSVQVTETSSPAPNLRVPKGFNWTPVYNFRPPYSTQSRGSRNETRGTRNSGSLLQGRSDTESHRTQTTEGTSTVLLTPMY